MIQLNRLSFGANDKNKTLTKKTKFIQLNLCSLVANHKKDKLDTIESMKFKRKSQNKDRIDSIESMKFRSKSQKKTKLIQLNL